MIKREPMSNEQIPELAPGIPWVCMYCNLVRADASTICPTRSDGIHVASLLASTEPEQPAGEGEESKRCVAISRATHRQCRNDAIGIDPMGHLCKDHQEGKVGVIDEAIGDYTKPPQSPPVVSEPSTTEGEREKADARDLRWLAGRIKRKHGFRIVGDEDALLDTCEGEPVETEGVGIYEDMPTTCPRCGDKLVLKMGHAVLYALPEPVRGDDKACPPEYEFCSRCREHTDFEHEDGEWLSTCCGAVASSCGE